MALSQALPFIDAFVKTVAEAVQIPSSTFQHGAQTAEHAVGTQRAAYGAVEAASV